MSLAIFGDLHANLAAFEAVLQAVGNVEPWLVLGDFVGYGPQPGEVLRLARHAFAGRQVMVVAGNHDRYALKKVPSWSGGTIKGGEDWERWTRAQLTAEDLQFLASLPSALEVRLPDSAGVAVQTLMSHNLPGARGYIGPGTRQELIEALIGQREESFFLFGHTHVPMDWRLASKRAINPGSVGQPRDGHPEVAFALWDRGEVRFERVSYDVERTIAALTSLPMTPQMKEMWVTNLRQGIVLPGSRPDVRL